MMLAMYLYVFILLFGGGVFEVFYILVNILSHQDMTGQPQYRLKLTTSAQNENAVIIYSHSHQPIDEVGPHKFLQLPHSSGFSKTAEVVRSLFFQDPKRVKNYC